MVKCLSKSCSLAEEFHSLRHFVPLNENIIQVRHLLLIDTNSSPTNLALQSKSCFARRDGWWWSEDAQLLYLICCVKREEREGEMAEDVIYWSLKFLEGREERQREMAMAGGLRGEFGCLVATSVNALGKGGCFRVKWGFNSNPLFLKLVYIWSDPVQFTKLQFLKLKPNQTKRFLWFLNQFFTLGLVFLVNFYFIFTVFLVGQVFWNPYYHPWSWHFATKSHQTRLLRF